MFQLMGVSISDHSAFYRTIIPVLSHVVQEISDQLIQEVRMSVNDGRSVSVVMDCGWSHPGWWATEATVIALDGQTGLPLGYINIIKVARNLENAMSFFAVFCDVFSIAKLLKAGSKYRQWLSRDHFTHSSVLDHTS